MVAFCWLPYLYLRRSIYICVSVYKHEAHWSKNERRDLVSQFPSEFLPYLRVSDGPSHFVTCKAALVFTK